MRYLPLFLLLASCQTWTWGGAADVLMPDEFTMGQGSSTMDTHTTGGYVGHNDMFAYDGEGEGESTYAALTWNLPSFGSDESGMDRETRRNLSLLIDKMVEEEIEAEAEADSPMREFALPTMKGRKPPAGVLWGLAAFIAAIVAVAIGKSRRKDPWS
jgi:hypothetical protein|tara:strand:- start:7696 stop:8166 length:471 start_codon:yes stop_codon:yes gene_type:complete